MSGDLDDEFTAEDKRTLKQLLSDYRDSSVTRRAAMGGTAAILGGAAFGAGRVTAQPDGSPSVIGQETDRTDVWGDQIDANVVDTGEIQLTQVEETSVSANTGSSYTVDLTQGTVWDLTLTASVTFSFTGAGDASGVNSFTLILTQDGTGGRSVTWPSSVQWGEGNGPSLSTAANTTDVLTFVTPDQGTTWYGFLGGTAFA